MKHDKIICPQCGKENHLICEYCGADLSSEVRKCVKSTNSYDAFLEKVLSNLEGIRNITFNDDAANNEDIAFYELPTQLDERIFVKYYDKFTGETSIFLTVFDWLPHINCSNGFIRLGSSKFWIGYNHKNGRGTLLFRFLGNDLYDLLFADEENITRPMFIHLEENENYTVIDRLNESMLKKMCDASCISIKQRYHIYEDKNGTLRLILQAFYNLLVDHEEYKTAMEKLYKYALKTDGANIESLNEKYFEHEYDEFANISYTNLRLFRKANSWWHSSHWLKIDDFLFDFRYIKKDGRGGFMFYMQLDEENEEENQKRLISNFDNNLTISTGEHEYTFSRIIYKEELEILCEAPMLYIQNKGQKCHERFIDRKGVLRNIAKVYYNAFYNSNRYADALESLLGYKKKKLMNGIMWGIVVGIFCIVILHKCGMS